jgi:hypothetical protein
MLERPLAPESIELPSCLCGAQMAFERTKDSDAETSIQVFRCSRCGHEMQLTVWASAQG